MVNVGGQAEASGFLLALLRHSFDVSACLLIPDWKVNSLGRSLYVKYFKTKPYVTFQLPV